MIQAAVFAVLGAIWLVAWFVVRRRIYRAMLEGRLSLGKGSAAFGLFWAAVPPFSLIWQPDTLPFILGLSALLFLTSAGVTYLLFRLMGPKPFG